MKSRVLFVGGFLGAGKTTLLWEASRRLTEMGKRVGLITNDQAPDLVDSALLAYTDLEIAEVSGSCFCCNFKGLMEAILYLKNEKQADIILAEPVGSCTDLSATILQPIKDQLKDEIELAPLTVLADPERLNAALNGIPSGLHDSAAYIIQKQLEEAEIILINKTDLYDIDTIEKFRMLSAEKWPLATIQTISLKDKVGLGAWLEGTMNRSVSGGHIAEVDYDVYALGEAVLGWLNAAIVLWCETAVDWNAFAKELLETLAKRFDDSGLAVGHVKVLFKSNDGFIIGNITGQKDTLIIRGSIGAETEIKMTVNARVQTEPDRLKAIVFEELVRLCKNHINMNIKTINCLKPGRPNPTYRFNSII